MTGNLFTPGEIIAPPRGGGIYQYIGPDVIYPDYHNVIQLRTHQGEWKVDTPRKLVGVAVSFLSEMEPLSVPKVTP